MQKFKEILYFNGDKYQGPLDSQNRYYGDGIYTFSNGSFYKGSFLAGVFHGTGVFSNKLLGISYEGIWNEGSLEGRSKVIYKNNAEYIGYIKDNMRYGKGILKLNNENIKYEGEFINDIFEGVGKLYINDKLEYEGDFRKGMKHGKGKEITDDYIYEGDFINGEKQGYGKLSIRNGDIYEGNFINNEKSGYGVYRYSDGPIYKGEYKHDKRSGKGILQFDKGKSIEIKDFNSDFIYEGGFINDLFEGKGHISLGDIEIEGFFAENSLVGKAKIIRKSEDGRKEALEGDYKENEKNGKVRLEIFGNKGEKKGEYNGEFIKDVEMREKTNFGNKF